MGIGTGKTRATPTTTKGGREAESAERVKEATACRNSPCPQNDGGVCIVEREECQRREDSPLIGEDWTVEECEDWEENHARDVLRELSPPGYFLGEVPQTLTIERLEEILGRVKKRKASVQIKEG